MRTKHCHQQHRAHQQKKINKLKKCLLECVCARESMKTVGVYGVRLISAPIYTINNVHIILTNVLWYRYSAALKLCVIAENYPHNTPLLPHYIEEIENFFATTSPSHRIILVYHHPPSHFNFDAKLFPLSRFFFIAAHSHFSQFGINDCENPFTTDSRGCYDNV